MDINNELLVCPQVLAWPHVVLAMPPPTTCGLLGEFVFCRKHFCIYLQSNFQFSYVYIPILSNYPD